MGADMTRPAVALLLSCILFTGCASRGGRIAAGAATMIVGGMFAATPGETTTHHPECNPSPCPGAVDALFTHDTTDHTPQIVGGLMLVTGAVLLIAGLATQDRPAEQASMPMPVQPVAYAPSPQRILLPSERLALQAQAQPQPVAVPQPAQAVIVGRIENRLAIQASMAAHAGHCSSAVITANKLAELDPELHVSLLERDTELALCYTASN
jgi:hypothetical protein